MTPPEVLEQLSGRVEDLERRVAQLEQRSLAAPDTIATETKLQHLPAPATSESWQMGPALTAVGISLLGIAGAYVLRALAGGAVLPRLILGLTGAAYGIGWAVAATRVSRKFSGGLYAATSVLILAPMLWEMCLRFQAMSPLLAAGVLAIYLATVLIAGRNSYKGPAFSPLFAGSAATALALCIGTRSMLPFIAILLAMTLFVEVQRIRSGALAVAPFVLLAMDAAIFALLVIYRMPAAGRLEYPVLSPAAVLAAPLLLLLMEATATAVHTCYQRQRMGIFDAFQLMAVFGMFAAGVFWMVAELAPSAIGSLCLVLCGACYWAAFDPFHCTAEPRNFRLFATWAVVLLACGLYLLEPPSWVAATCAVAALGTILAAPRLHSTTLEAHSIVYLALAAFACGLPAYAWHVIIADIPVHLGWPIALFAAVALAGYALCHEQQSEDSAHRAIHLVLALLATFAACALLTHGLLAVTGLAVHPEPFHIALLRTVAVCAVALTLALGGVRLQRITMSRVAYVLLAFVVLKLVFEDLRHGHLAFLAASIGIVAVTLIAVPRIANRQSSGQVIRRA
ncbi:hypothetical protein [Occallatibacter riparius]|uniref:DUF2339 domain-containing protein n=1 Tax=Occallatibacter riparius TaxID=1002689 RepID=A0A9J7BTF4_9BACT|nr:hypothetical protein [Occallatibacter riparius]UWZ85928.1 hypothetical protein MOP44_08280 [Occallatibacter riparius]